jgi:hypothetical protein
MVRNGLCVSAFLIALAGCNAQQTHSVLLMEITFDGVCIPESCQEQNAQFAQGLTMQLAKMPKCAGLQTYDFEIVSVVTSAEAARTIAPRL